MNNNMPDKFDDSVMNQTILDTGSQVGDLAMEYFGDFTEVEFSKDKMKMVKETEKLMQAGIRVIAEAAFEYNGDFCIVDILLAVPGGGYELIEVKSASGSPGDTADKVKDVYLYDMSFQAYILTQNKLDIKSVKLMCINRDYVFKDKLNIQELFVLIDCTKKVFEMTKDVAKNIEDFKAFMTQENEPIVDIGSRCGNPYECGYKKWCYRELPEEKSIFHIGWSIRSSRTDQAHKDGIHSFEDALKAYNDGKLKLNDKQLRHVQFVVNDMEPHIDKEGINKFLSLVRYPLYFLDFETFSFAIPQWDNTSPFKAITFQYSLHIQNERGGELIHKEFLGEGGKDPRRKLAEKLCADIPADACVVSYNMGFEKNKIKVMAEMFPDLSAHLLKINENMIDVMIPFST